MKNLLSTLLLALLAGCASPTTPPAAATSAAADPTMVCEREYRVGSTIPKLVCSAPMTEAERQQMREALRNEIRPAPSVMKGGGGA